MDAPRTLAVVLIIIALIGLVMWAAFRYQGPGSGYGVHSPAPSPGVPATTP